MLFEWKSSILKALGRFTQVLNKLLIDTQISSDMIKKTKMNIWIQFCSIQISECYFAYHDICGHFNLHIMIILRVRNDLPLLALKSQIQSPGSMCNSLEVYYYKWHCTIWSRWSSSYYVLLLITMFIFVFVVLVKHEYGWRSNDNNFATHTHSIYRPINIRV